MKRGVDLRSLAAILVWGGVPAYADEGGMDGFGSVFLTVFLAYCALIAVSHLTEFLRLRLFRKREGDAREAGRVTEEG